MSASEQAPVEVVIACHSDRRPIGRAVASVLDGNGADARVSVVAHNIDPERLLRVLAPAHRGRVRMLHLADGIPSPAGPFSLGLERASAPWVSLMGSDDRLLPGTVRSWRAVAARTRAEAVLTRLALGSPDRVVPTPPVRLLPVRGRDVVADRLSYRSAPLGMLRTDLVRRLDLRLEPGLPVGEDVAFTTRLVCQARVAVDLLGPTYVIGEDATDRVTLDRRPMHDQLGFVDALLDADWLRSERPAVRRAVAVKVLRIHVFGAIHYRPDAAAWGPGDRRELARITRRVLEAAGGAPSSLSLAERDLARAASDPDTSASVLTDLSRARRRHGAPRTVLPSAPDGLLAPDGPVRFMAASVGARLTGFLRPPSRAAQQGRSIR